MTYYNILWAASPRHQPGSNFYSCPDLYPNKYRCRIYIYIYIYKYKFRVEEYLLTYLKVKVHLPC